METMAWAIHRYIMHGFGWSWHRSHHQARDGLLEKNDLYAVVFAGLALISILCGTGMIRPLYWVGLGMTLYGVLYFLLHDGLVHRRWPFHIVPRQAYLKRLVQAHRLHHAVKQREGAVSFGFLYAPPVHRLRETLRQRGTANRP